MRSAVARREVEQRGRREPVVDDDVGGGEQLGAPHGQQPGITGAGADEVDGHATVLEERAPAELVEQPVRRFAPGRVRVGAGRPRPQRRSGRRASRAAPRGRRRRRRGAPVVGDAPGKRAARQVAPATELVEERPLGVDGRVRARVVDRRRATAQRVASSSARHSTASAPCATCGSRTARFEALRDPVGEPEAVERGGGDHDRVEARGLVEPGPDVAAQLGEGEVGPEVRELGPAAHRAGRHHGRRPGASASVAPTSASRGIGPLGHRRQHEAGRRLAGRSLAECTARSASTAEHGVLDLLHEDARPAERVDRHVGPPVTGRLHDDELATGPRAGAATRSAWSRASALPARRDAQRPAQPAHQSVVGGSSGSSSANSSDSASAYSSPRADAGGVLEPHGRLVEQLVDEAARDRTRRPRGPPGSSASSFAAWRCSSHGAQHLGALAQRGDERGRLACRPLEAVPVELVGDDLAHRAELGAALLERLLALGAAASSMSRSVTPKTSPTPGSTSRGTATSTTSSARPDRRSITCSMSARSMRTSGGARARQEHVAAARAGRGSSSSAIAAAAEPGRERGTARAACGWRRRSRRRPRPRARSPSSRRRRPRRARGPAGPRASRAVRRPPRPRPTGPDTAWRPMPVSVRARLPTSTAWRNVRDRNWPTEPSRSATCHASRTWPRISPSPMIMESRPAATPKRCATAASSWYV